MDASGGLPGAVVNLAWAPVFVIELAGVEERLTWLRRPIVVWWLVWVASTAVSVFSIATSFATDAQAIADNTVMTTVAYLLALAALLLADEGLRRVRAAACREARQSAG